MVKILVEKDCVDALIAKNQELQKRFTQYAMSVGSTVALDDDQRGGDTAFDLDELRRAAFKGDVVADRILSDLQKSKR
jgi:hypothetical protein